MTKKEAELSLVKVLVAEDNYMNREIVKAFLELRNINAIFVQTGLEALNMLEKERFDFVLMDVQMPEMDGIEATIIIRNKGNNIPIVAMTAYATIDDKAKCLDSGMNYYISKPIFMKDFFNIIDDILNRLNCGLV